MILDEAPGIRADIYDAIEGIRAGGEVHVLAIGNPTAVGGPFYDAFHRGRASWHTVTISAFDTPNLCGLTIPGVRGAPRDGRSLLQLSDEELNVAPRPYLVTRRWVKEKYLEWGPTSPLWQSRVMGEFPAEGHDTLIPLALIEAAQARVLRAGSPVELGVDVGWFGDDASVIALRRGPVVEILDVAHKADTMATAARVAHALRRHTDITYARVDSVGVGAGVVDRLRGDNLPVVGLNAGWSARDGERFANARAEWYWGLRERFEAGDIALGSCRWVSRRSTGQPRNPYGGQLALTLLCVTKGVAVGNQRKRAVAPLPCYWEVSWQQHPWRTRASRASASASGPPSSVTTATTSSGGRTAPTSSRPGRQRQDLRAWRRRLHLWGGGVRGRS